MRYSIRPATAPAEWTTGISFVVPGQPIPKGRPRLGRGGHTYTPPRTAEAEAHIVAHLKAQYPHLRPSAGRLGVVVAFHVSRGRGALCDADNLLKTLLDAGHGCLWLNDNQIDRIDVTVFRDSAQPRMAVTVYEIPSVGRSAA